AARQATVSDDVGSTERPRRSDATRGSGGGLGPARRCRRQAAVALPTLVTRVRWSEAQASTTGFLRIVETSILTISTRGFDDERTNQQARLCIRIVALHCDVEYSVKGPETAAE